MNAEKIGELERRVTGVEATINPLVRELRNLTESNVHLTSEIKHMVKTVEKVIEDNEKLEERVIENAKEIAVMKTKINSTEWVKRTIAGTVITIILTALYVTKG